MMMRHGSSSSPLSAAISAASVRDTDAPISRIIVALFFILIALFSQAQAHGFRPAQLEIDEVGEGRYMVLWASNDTAETTEFVTIDPLGLRFPAHCERQPFPGDGAGSYFRLDCQGEGLVGECIRVLGLTNTTSQAVVTVRLRNPGRRYDRLLRYGDDTLCISQTGDAWAARAASYLEAGFHHILGGVDHLLFLLTLVLLFQRAALRLALVTAFTVGHSLSLALATLDWVTPPMTAIEILIAWTVVFAAYEAFHAQSDPARATSSITQRLPWLVTGGFGFVHGFGFASALREIGFESGANLLIPLASFNVGVELGQLGVLAVVLAAEWVARYLPLGVRMRQRIGEATAFAIGSLAMFWVFERSAGLLT
ncbi:MAG: HupE/UreJ family protein [Pseudomonadota bacterium]